MENSDILFFRLQIRVLGVPQTGAKSRVETQIKLCIQLVTDGGDKAQWWSHLKLPENMVTKEKAKRSYGGRSTSTDNGLPANPEKMLYLRARVLCASDPTKKVLTCMGCIQREVSPYHYPHIYSYCSRSFSVKDLKEERKTNQAIN